MSTPVLCDCAGRLCCAGEAHHACCSGGKWRGVRRVEWGGVRGVRAHREANSRNAEILGNLLEALLDFPDLLVLDGESVSEESGGGLDRVGAEASEVEKSLGRSILHAEEGRYFGSDTRECGPGGAGDGAIRLLPRLRMAENGLAGQPDCVGC